MMYFENYKITGILGKGTYGEVFKAETKKTGEIVALKKILMENETEGFPKSALNEIKILQALKHENVVNLVEVCRSTPTNLNRQRSVFLVLEFCQYDLTKLITNTSIRFPLGDIKKLMLQLLEGLFHMHRCKVFHLDIKSANILITGDGTLKITDFGLARPFTVCKEGEENRYPNNVVTLWYRAPELLLGERNYGPSVDIWAAGCVFCELWMKRPLMSGKGERNQLDLITYLCGSITPKVWPGVEKLQHYQQYIVNDNKQHNRQRLLTQRLNQIVRDKRGLDLVDKLLCLDPKKDEALFVNYQTRIYIPELKLRTLNRLTANEALNHDIFFEEPLPSESLKCLETLKKQNSRHLQQNHQTLKVAKQHQHNNRHHPYNNRQHQSIFNNKQCEERVW